MLIGINQLREGLDIPEVSLVAVLDADKEGFLRSERSLIQTCGRAARNAAGMVIMYADEVTGSMQRTIDETNRRRTMQKEYNQTNEITPTTVISPVKDTIHQYLKEAGYQFDDQDNSLAASAEEEVVYGSVADLDKEIDRLEMEMNRAAAELAFEEAAVLRDKIKALRMLEIEIG